MRLKSILITLAVLISTIALAQWTALKGPAGGTVTDLKTDPINSKLYAVSSGTLYVSDFGDTWTEIKIPVIFPVAAVVPNGNQIQAAFFDGIRVSTDGGQTWTLKHSGYIGDDHFFKSAIANHYFIHDGNGNIHVSVDGGATYKKIYSGGAGKNIIDVKQASNGDLYAMEQSAGVIKLPFPANPEDTASWSPDNWITVHPHNTVDKDIYSIQMALAIGANDRLFIGIHDDAVSYSYETSTDGGATWSSLPMTGATPTLNPASHPLFIVTPAGKLLVMDSGSTKAWEYTDGDPTPWIARQWPTATRSLQATTTLAYRNNDLYAGASIDGIFKTSNDAASWAQSCDGMLEGNSTQAIVLDDGKIIVVQGTNPYGFYYSLNGGDIWSFKNTSFPVNTVIKLPDNTLFASDLVQSTYTSSDGGDTWIQHSNPAGVYFRTFVVVAANDIYAFGDNGALFETIDKGQTWTTINVNGFTTANSEPSKAARDADGNFYLLTYAWENGGPTGEAWKLDSKTSPWTATELATPLDLKGNISYWNAFVSSNKLYVTDGARSNFVTADHGTTWKQLNINGFLMPIAGGMAASTAGNIAITQDDGLTVRNIQVPVESATITQLAVNAAGGFYIASASQSPVLKFTGSLTLPTAQLQPYIDYGWQTVPGGPFGGGVTSVKFSPSGSMYASSNLVLYRYDAVNSIWKKISTVSVLGFNVDSSGNVYIVSYNGRVFKSSDGGNSFTQQGLIYNDGSSGVSRGIIKTSSGALFFSMDDGLFKSTDDGATFALSDAGDHYSIFESDNGTLLAVRTATGTSTLVRSVDGGATWSPSSTGIDPAQLPLAVFSAESNVLITVAGSDVYRSTDDGVTWTSISNDLPFGYGTTSGFSILPTGEYLIAWGSNYFISANHGLNWTKQSGYYDPGAITLNGNDVYIASVFGLYKSTDKGATVNPFNENGITALGTRTIKIAQGSLITVGETNPTRLLTSNDKGATWIAPSIQLQNVSGIIETNGIVYAYGSGPSGNIVKSTDGGMTWTPVASPGGTAYINQMCTSDGIFFYAFGYESQSRTYKFYKTTDMNSWSEFGASGWPQSSVVGMASDDTYLYAIVGYENSDAERVYQIAFGVATKVDQVQLVSSIQSSGGKIYALNHTGILYQKSAGSWTHKSVPIGVELSIAAKELLYITNDQVGVYVSRDDGTTWQDIGPIPDGVTFGRVVNDEFTGIAYVATRGGGVMKSSTIIFPDDKTGPVRSATSPPDDAATVAIDSKLSVTFDEAAFPVSGKNLRVYVAGAVNAAYVIDATQATRADKTYTFTLPSSLIYSTNYYVVIDNGAFKDLFGNAYTGISDQTSWNFTTVEAPDLIPPSVQATGGNLEVGSGNREIDFSVTDNKSVATTAKFYVRDITTKDFGPPQVLTGNPTSETMKFSAFITEDTYKKIGVAYYFEVTDLANNLTRYPADPTAYAYSYLTYPQSKNPTLPALPTGGSVEDYRMISLPYQFEDNKISTLFSALGEPDNKAWRLLTHGGGSNTNWLEYSSGGITTIERGTGYWINVKNATTISFNGSSVAANNPSAWFSMLLKPGWNQVGDPYTIQISWDEIRATNSNIGKLKVLKDNAYSDSPTLDPYGAGFVFLSGSAPVSIPITFPGFSAGRIAGVQFGTDLGSDIWKLPITIEQGNATSNFSGIGMHNDASEDFDGFDDLNPPPFVKLLQVNFPHPQSDPKKLALDIVPTQAGHQWSFTVDTDTKEEVKLSWDNSGLGNNSKEIFLLDENSQTLVNMRDVSSYSFKPITSHPFKLFFGENLGNRIMPTRILTGDPYPNPTNGLVSLPFTLSGDSDDYRVSLDIMDVMGRPVGRMADQIMSPGFHTTTWMADETTTTGLYLLRIKIQGKEKSYVETKRIVLKR